MGNISYTAHVSNKKSAITSKSKLAAVAKHTLSSKYIFSVRMEYVGGLARDCKTPCYTNTDAQKAALRKLLDDLHKCYSRTLIAGISDLDPKKPCCPGFDANKEYRDLESVV